VVVINPRPPDPDQGGRRAAAGAGVGFEFCYHVRGTAEWNLVWSQALSKYDALNDLCWFVRDEVFIDVSDLM